MRKGLQLKLTVELLPEQVITRVNEIPVNAEFKSAITQTKYTVFDAALGQIVQVGGVQF